MTEAKKLDPADPQPGLYRAVPMDTYLRLPCLSASGLEVFRRSPKHYHERVEQEATPAMTLGTAVHTALLEPEDFAATYVRGIDGDGRTKAVKDARRELEEQHPGATVLSGAEYDTVSSMVGAIRSHPRASTLFTGSGDVEVTGIFDDPDTGLRIKIRPDRLIRRAGMLVDLKTAADASQDGFARASARLGYHRKMALYRRGLRALGWDCTASAICAMETSPPYAVGLYLLDEAQLERAERDVVRLLHQFAFCSSTDSWPGYGSDEFRTLYFPDFAFDREELATTEMAA
jgi:hypothetical protein